MRGTSLTPSRATPFAFYSLVSTSRFRRAPEHLVCSAAGGMAPLLSELIRKRCSWQQPAQEVALRQQALSVRVSWPLRRQNGGRSGGGAPFLQTDREGGGGRLRDVGVPPAESDHGMHVASRLRPTWCWSPRPPRSRTFRQHRRGSRRQALGRRVTSCGSVSRCGDWELSVCAIGFTWSDSRPQRTFRHSRHRLSVGCAI
jgi:hypothetical protein